MSAKSAKEKERDLKRMEAEIEEIGRPYKSVLAVLKHMREGTLDHPKPEPTHPDAVWQHLNLTPILNRGLKKSHKCVVSRSYDSSKK